MRNLLTLIRRGRAFLAHIPKGALEELVQEAAYYLNIIKLLPITKEERKKKIISHLVYYIAEKFKLHIPETVLSVIVDLAIHEYEASRRK